MFGQPLIEPLQEVGFIPAGISPMQPPQFEERSSGGQGGRVSIR